MNGVLSRARCAANAFDHAFWCVELHIVPRVLQQLEARLWKDGIGLAILPSHVVAAQVRSGQLVRVLEHARLPELPHVLSELDEYGGSHDAERVRESQTIGNKNAQIAAQSSEVEPPPARAW